MISENNKESILALKKHLHTTIRIKDLGDLRYFLGIEVARSKKGICLNQRKYALELISGMELSGAKVFETPMEQNLRLTTKEYDDEKSRRIQKACWKTIISNHHKASYMLLLSKH